MIGKYRPYYGPVTVVAIWHIANGLAAMVEPRVAFISALSQLPSHYLALLLVFTGVFALWARWSTNRWAWVLIIPQEAILMIQGYAIVWCIVHGQYPNGHIPVPNDLFGSKVFIYADQFLILVLVLWHTIEMCLMTFFTVSDKEEADEIKSMRQRLAIYEEGAYWDALIDKMMKEKRGYGYENDEGNV